MSNTPVEILKELQELTPIAMIDVDLGDPRSRVGRESMKRNAEARVFDLKRALGQKASELAHFMVLKGATDDAAIKFAAIAGVFDVLTVDYQSWDKTIGKALFASTDGKGGIVGPHHQVMLMASIRSIMADLEMYDLAAPNLPIGTYLETEQQWIDCVTEVTTRDCGLAFRARLMTDAVSRELLGLPLSADVLHSPAVLVVALGVPEDHAVALRKGMGSRFWAVYFNNVTSDDIDEKVVENELKKVTTHIKKSLKSNK